MGRVLVRGCKGGKKHVLVLAACLVAAGSTEVTGQVILPSNFNPSRPGGFRLRPEEAVPGSFAGAGSAGDEVSGYNALILLNAYGRCPVPTIARGDLIPEAEDGTTNPGGDPANPIRGGGYSGLGGGGRVPANLPPSADVLPSEARNYFRSALSRPHSSPVRVEAERALSNLATLPTGQVRPYFAVPGSLPSQEQGKFLQERVRDLAERKGAAAPSSRFAVVVAPATGFGVATASGAKAVQRFAGLGADDLLAASLRGATPDKELNGFGSGLLQSLQSRKSDQVWFADGAEQVLPRTAGTLSSPQAGADAEFVVAASRSGAKALRAADAMTAADLIKEFSAAAEKIGTRERAIVYKAVANTVGPTGLMTYAQDATTALEAAKAIKANRRFSQDGAETRVLVLLQGAQGTEMLVY